jgi:hypothetical protein
MLGGANLNNTSCTSHIVWCITLVLTKNAHVRSIRIPFKRLAFGSRELLQASSARYLQDNDRVERREGDLHYNLNRKSLASPCCLDEQQFDPFLKYWTIGVLWRYTESWYFVRKKWYDETRRHGWLALHKSGRAQNFVFLHTGMILNRPNLCLARTKELPYFLSRNGCLYNLWSLLLLWQSLYYINSP